YPNAFQGLCRLGWCLNVNRVRDDRLALCGKSDWEFEFVIDDLFDGNRCEASIGEQDGERRFVFIEFVLRNRRMVNQLLNTKPSDHFSLRYSQAASDLQDLLCKMFRTGSR